MNTILKQIITILLLSIILGLLRFTLINDKNFTLIKETIEEVEDCIVDTSVKMTKPKNMPIDCVKYYFDNKTDTLKSGAIIIDSRDKEEYSESHIKGSFNILVFPFLIFLFFDMNLAVLGIICINPIAPFLLLALLLKLDSL